MTLLERLAGAWDLLLGKQAASAYAPFGAVGRGLGSYPIYDRTYLESYEQVSTVHAAVSRIAADCASVPLRVMRRGADGELVALDPAKDEPARVLQAANPIEGAVSLWRRFWTSKLLAGEAFVLTDRLGRATPQELWVLRPDLMTPKLTATGMPKSYEYRTEGSGRVIAYKPDEIWQSRYPNLLSDAHGLSPLRAAKTLVELESNAVAHWAQFFKLGARLGLLLETEKAVTKEQMQRFLAEWREVYSGVGKSFQVGVVHSGYKARDLGVTPREADFVGLFQTVREQILAVLGVPPALCGVYQYANYANSAQQIAIYWQNTIVPNLRAVEEELTEVVLPRWQPGLVAKFDLDAVPAVQEMELDRAQRLSALVASGLLSLNAARQQIGEPRVVMGDQAWLPITLVPVGSEIRPQPGAPARSRGKWIDDPERHEKRRRHLRRMDQFEKPALQALRAAIDDQEERVLARLDQAKAIGKRTGLEDVWDDQVEQDAMVRVATRVYARTVAARGQEAAEEIGAEEFLLDDPRVAHWLVDEGFREGVLLTGRTKDLVRAALVEAAQAGETVQGIADRLSAAFDLRRFEALRIARTETVQAYNFASVSAWDQSEVVAEKEWLTAGDEAVRASHQALDGAVVPLDEPFLSGDGNSLEFPGDPTAPAEDVVNCRCTVLPVLGERGRSVRVSQEAWTRLATGANGRPDPSPRVVLAGAGEAEEGRGR